MCMLRFLCLTPAFWKKINNEALDESDLKSLDAYSWQVLQDLRCNA